MPSNSRRAEQNCQSMMVHSKSWNIVPVVTSCDVAHKRLVVNRQVLEWSMDILEPPKLPCVLTMFCKNDKWLRVHLNVQLQQLSLEKLKFLSFKECAPEWAQWMNECIALQGNEKEVDTQQQDLRQDNATHAALVLVWEKKRAKRSHFVVLTQSIFNASHIKTRWTTTTEPTWGILLLCESLLWRLWASDHKMWRSLSVAPTNMPLEFPLCWLASSKTNVSWCGGGKVNANDTKLSVLFDSFPSIQSRKFPLLSMLYFYGCRIGFESIIKVCLMSPLHCSCQRGYSLTSTVHPYS